MSGEARLALHASYEALGASFVTVRGRLVPERFGEVEDECQAVRTAAGVVDRSDLGYLTASGGDAQRFLQGMVTNDVAALAPGQGTYAVHLTTQAALSSPTGSAPALPIGPAPALPIGPVPSSV